MAKMTLEKAEKAVILIKMAKTALGKAEISVI
jgi:hypothetical protein